MYRYLGVQMTAFQTFRWLMAVGGIRSLVEFVLSQDLMSDLGLSPLSHIWIWGALAVAFSVLEWRSGRLNVTYDGKN